jgi:hypothetical protein
MPECKLNVVTSCPAETSAAPLRSAIRPTATSIPACTTSPKPAKKTLDSDGGGGENNDDKLVLKALDLPSR